MVCVGESFERKSEEVFVIYDILGCVIALLVFCIAYTKGFDMFKLDFLFECLMVVIFISLVLVMLAALIGVVSWMCLPIIGLVYILQ